METISSRNNSKIKYACSLKENSMRKAEKKILIEGLRLCLDAAVNSVEIEECFLVAERVESDDCKKIIEHSNNVYIIEEHVAQKLSDTKNNQGVFCVCKLNESENEFDNNGVYILLENIQNPGNLGAIMRTAEAFGVSGAITYKCCDRYSPKALRSAMGSAFRMSVFNIEDEEAFIKEKQKNGIELYCAVVDKSAEEIQNIKKRIGVIIAVGNEGNGLSEEIISLGKGVTIKMKGRAESLNAFQAASILMYEMMNRND